MDFEELEQMVLHGMRNPIVTIGGFSRRLLRALPEGDPRKKFAEIVIKEIERLEGICFVLNDDIHNARDGIITRSIEFAPEHKQVGVSILSYFGQVLQQKYPNIEARVKIEQKGNLVTLIVNTAAGEVSRMEESLDLFGKVVCGKEPPSALLSDSNHVQELKTKLEIAALELRLTKEHYIERDKTQEDRIKHMESEINFIREYIGTSLMQRDRVYDFVDSLIERSINGSDVSNTLKTIAGILVHGNLEQSETYMKDALTELKVFDKGVFQQFIDFVLNMMANASGNVIGAWLLRIIDSMPK